MSSSLHKSGKIIHPDFGWDVAMPGIGSVVNFFRSFVLVIGCVDGCRGACGVDESDGEVCFSRGVRDEVSDGAVLHLFKYGLREGRRIVPVEQGPCSESGIGAIAEGGDAGAAFGDAEIEGGADESEASSLAASPCDEVFAIPFGLFREEIECAEGSQIDGYQVRCFSVFPSDFEIILQS